MAIPRSTLLASFVLVPLALAQGPVGDRPKVVESKPLTKEELKREEAELLLRHARSLYGLAVLRQRHEKLLEAVTTLEKAAALDPESTEIRRALVPLYVIIGRDEQAMRLCREILDRDPFDAEVAHPFAKLLKIDGKSNEAIAVLQKVVSAKNAAARPERLLFMLSDLCDLLEQKKDYASEAKAQEAIIRTITEKREQLLFGNGFTRDDLTGSLARSYERLGRDRIQLKEYDQAVKAFGSARETLLKSEAPEARHQAVRLSLNLSELAIAQERWADALQALDAYLEHGPSDMAPYEKKIEILRKLGREHEVIPAIKRYAEREQSHVGLQLLLAREMANDPRSRKEAESLYIGLLKKNIKPEIYRGLFKLYAQLDRMNKVLDLLDESEKVLKAKEGEVNADDRESAAARKRAMLIVLRSEPEVVYSLLQWALDEVSREKPRQFNTWLTMAFLAQRAHKLADAEKFFRQSLLRAAGQNSDSRVYQGLVVVLMLQKKYEDVVKFCQDQLASRRVGGVGLDGFFHSQIAAALAEMGHYEEALQHCDKAIKASSEEDTVRERCQKARILGLAERYDEAIRECLDTMKEFPQQIRVQAVRIALSGIYTQKGDHEKSEEQLRLILEVDPDAHLANNNLGYQMADRNINLDDAERLIRRAIDTERSIRKAIGEDGDNAAYLDSLGWVLFRKGKLDEAREWLEKAAALPEGADDPTVWDHLGDVYAKLGQTGKAKEIWTKSLKLYNAGARPKSDGKRTEVVKKLKTVE